jgi:hypothetical protein
MEKPTILHNTSCAYCGGAFSAEIPNDKEHVIGRNFVPSGSLPANAWNLFLQACRPCNQIKAKLESEVSAITLQPAIGKRHSDVDIADIATRKAAKVRSSLTGKLVGDSIETPKIEVPIADGISMSFGFVAPPQLSSRSIRGLAGAHVHAFYYAATYDPIRRCGNFFPYPPAWMRWTRRSDWGNKTFVSFADMLKGWSSVALRSAANGYFKVNLKQAPNLNLWGFALEWNRSYRVIGLIGPVESVAPLIAEMETSDDFPQTPPGSFLEEIAPSESLDQLFV